MSDPGTTPIQQDVNRKPPKPKLPKPSLPARKPSLKPAVELTVTDSSPGAGSTPKPKLINKSENSGQLEAKPRPPLSRTSSPLPNLSRSSTPLPPTPGSSSHFLGTSPPPLPAPRSPIFPVDEGISGNIPAQDDGNDDKGNCSPMLPKGSKTFEWRPQSTSTNQQDLQRPFVLRASTSAPHLDASPPAPQPRYLQDAAAQSSSSIPYQPPPPPLPLRPNQALEIKKRSLDCKYVNYRPPTCNILLPTQAEITAAFHVNDQCILVCTRTSASLLAADLTPVWVTNDFKIACCTALNNQIWIGELSGHVVCLDLESGKCLYEPRTAHSKSVLNIWTDLQQHKVLSLGDDGKVLIWEGVNVAPRVIRTVPSAISSSTYGDGKLYITTKNSLYAYDLLGNDSASHQAPRKVDWPTQTLSSTRNNFCSLTIFDSSLVCGHNDGMISVFSLGNLEPRYSLATGIYAVNSLTTVGSNIWLGLSSGSLSVIDPIQCKMLKEWKTNSSAPINKVAKLTIKGNEVVVSTSDTLFLWDATLQDDEEDRYKALGRDSLAETSNKKIRIVSWNVDSRDPSTMAPELMRDNCMDGDLIVIGLQEVVELGNKTKTAKKLASGGDQTEHREYGLWKNYLNMCLRSQYTLVFEKALVGLYLIVFTRSSSVVHNITSTLVKTGMGGLHGNKGGIVLSLDMEGTSLCFINCHLAAGHTQIIQRNRDAAQVIDAPVRESLKPLDHDYCFFFGDTNYRINTARELAVKYIKDGNLERLEALDQLNGQRRKNPGFCLNAFSEAPLSFAPTYKFDRNTDNYDSSDKKRVPAWCDRILYRGDLTVDTYTSIIAHYSDHKPISGLYEIKVRKY